MKASDLFVKALETEGVEYVFGIPGEENLDFLDSLSRSEKIRLILTRHEQAAGFMAATYGRFTGKTGVCLSTLGPGATNFVTAAAYAQLGGMPMMMLTGQKPVKKSKQGRFQILDVVDMMGPLTKYTHQIVAGDNIPSRVREAFRLAEDEKPGAVHLELPEDIADEQTDLLPISPARARLAFDELLANQLALSMVRRQARDTAPGRCFAPQGQLLTALTADLPFEMTAAQHAAIGEITADQAAPKRMLRMLQGDVGSGKTLVALVAMLTVAETGAQAALLAPTEVLARQHHANLNALLRPLKMEVGLLLGQGRTNNAAADDALPNGVNHAPRTRKDTLAAMADGTISLVVGTHALLSDTAIFHDLGLAVIDEQHRFGVRQRILLGEKGRDVDVLVMTATPIPRSLAMTAYGDLDHSRLDEKPVGRLPIDTRALAKDRLNEIVDGLRRALHGGKRAYWICPLVDESDKLDIAAAEDRFTALTHALAGIGVALAHGKMKAAERDAAMQAFRTGQAQLLVATTVVEVGVDVPEASIIVIEHAERFGLAQLHQLRGRVGRSTAQSSCLLVYQPPLSETANKRLSVMRDTNDGFVIAEEDLSLRGPGEFLGQRQSGVPEFVLADLAAHHDLLAIAREQAQIMLAGNGMHHINLLLSLFERDSAVKFLAAG